MAYLQREKNRRGAALKSAKYATLRDMFKAAAAKETKKATPSVTQKVRRGSAIASLKRIFLEPSAARLEAVDTSRAFRVDDDRGSTV